jgi:DNA relaxase TraI-like protein
MATVEELTEQILYRLSLDPRARELVARLLERLQGLVSDLPASADHHHRSPGGLFQHSLELAVILPNLGTFRFGHELEDMLVIILERKRGQVRGVHI